MKKLVSAVLALLMVFSLASCGGKLDAKEIYIEALKNTKTYTMDMDMEMSMTAEGETIALKIGLDGDVDAKQNMKLSYLIGDATSGMNYTGEAYLLLDTFEIYASLMGMWLNIGLDDIEALTGQPVDMTQFNELIKQQQDTVAYVNAMGMEFGEITEENGLYKFNITFGDKAVQMVEETMLGSTEGLSEEDIAMMKEIIEQADIGSLLKALSVEVHINAKEKTLAYCGGDFTKAMADYMKRTLDAAAELDPEAAGANVSVDKMVVTVNITNAGNVTAITVPDTVKQGAMSIMDLVQMLMYYGAE